MNPRSFACKTYATAGSPSGEGKRICFDHGADNFGSLLCSPRYVIGMDRLTTEQPQKIRDAIGPMTVYLWCMLERMDRTNLRKRDHTPAITAIIHPDSVTPGGDLRSTWIGRPKRLAKTNREWS
jgi:hypothetical protein